MLGAAGYTFQLMGSAKNIFVCSFLNSHKVRLWLHRNLSPQDSSTHLAVLSLSSLFSFTCSSALYLVPLIVPKELGFWSHTVLDLTLSALVSPCEGRQGDLLPWEPHSRGLLVGV